MTNQKAEEITAYVCDNLCRHSHNNDLTQDNLDEICDKCKVTEWAKKISDQKPKISDQKPKILAQSDSADSVTSRNFIMGRFMEIK